MLSNWWLTSLACVEVSALAVAVFVMMRRPQLIAKWPSLFTSLATEFVADMLLLTWLSDRSHYKQYFYVYWGSVGLRALLRLWIIADIVQSFPGLDFLPRRLYLFVGTLGATMAAASGWCCFHDPGKFSAHIKDWAVMLNQCVNMGWAAFAIAVLASIKLLNIGWDKRGMGIATGVFLRVCGNLITGELYATTNHFSFQIHGHLFEMSAKSIRLLGNGLDSVFSIALFLFWSFMLLQPLDAHASVVDKEDEATATGSMSTLLAFSTSRERMKAR